MNGAKPLVEVRKQNTFRGHNDCIYTIQGSNEGQFYTGAGDGMVVLWDLRKKSADGKLIAKVPNSIYALALDEQRKRLYVGHNYDGVHVIDLAIRKEIYSLKLTTTAIFDMSIHGHHLFVSCGDGQIVVVDIREEPRELKRIKESQKSARSISISDVLEEIAVGFSDHTVRIYDLNTLNLKHTITGHINSVFTVRYSPDDLLLFTAGRDAHLKIWDTRNYQLKESIVAHMYAINHVDFSPNNKHFVTCSMDKAIKVWDMQTFRLLKVIDKARHAGHGTSVNKLFWSDYQDLLVSTGDDRTVSVWEINIK